MCIYMYIYIYAYMYVDIHSKPMLDEAPRGRTSIRVVDNGRSFVLHFQAILT